LFKGGKSGTGGGMVDVVMLVRYAVIDIEGVVAAEVVDD
jgi:hypothetical protein